MQKVKMTPEMDQEPNSRLPEMPGSGQETGQGSPSSQSTGLESDVAAVDEGLAGDLIGLPFEAWAVFQKDVPKEAIVLSEQQKQFLGGPVSRVLTKYGLGKIAKDEVVIVAVLSMHVFHVTSEIKKAKAQKFAGPDAK
jgi:hypothetical protein